MSYIKLWIEGAIKDLDLNDNLITQITNYRFPQDQPYEYLSKAIFHCYNNNPQDCIKEGFKVIENKREFFTSYDEFEVLRDLFSHGQIPGYRYQENTIKRFESTFKNDPFDYTIENGLLEINWKSNKNHSKLNSISNKLIHELKTYLKL